MKDGTASHLLGELRTSASLDQSVRFVYSADVCSSVKKGPTFAHPKKDLLKKDLQKRPADIISHT